MTTQYGYDDWIRELPRILNQPLEWIESKPVYGCVSFSSNFKRIAFPLLLNFRS